MTTGTAAALDVVDLHARYERDGFFVRERAFGEQELDALRLASERCAAEAAAAAVAFPRLLPAPLLGEVPLLTPWAAAQGAEFLDIRSLLTG